MSTPKTIILIPHYNNLEGLETSISSIDESMIIDILIVDDGSLIKPNADSLTQFYRNGNVFVSLLRTNMGIEHALNEGLKWILQKDYHFIGRLDCGDICYPNKFQIQINHLQQNKETMLLGTQVNFKNENGGLLFCSNLPTSYNQIRKWFYINCVIIHPTVIFRSEIFDNVGLYPTNYEAAEDYALFFNIVKKYKAENLNQILLDVIVDTKGISVLKREVQIKNKLRLIKHHFYFGFYPLYGLVRNIILLSIPYSLLMKIKILSKRKRYAG